MTGDSRSFLQVFRDTLIRRSAGLFSFLLFAFLFCFLFDGILFHGGQFGYRDSGYFYYPLLMQIQEEFNKGRVPLWDPYENLGEPLAANPAAAVFYPVRAFFFAGTRFSIPYHICFKYYILFHLATAFLTFLYMARLPLSSRKPLLSRSGSFFAAFAWCFGGDVLFQTTNVIFLTGAAWLPLLIAFECRLLLTGFRWTNILGTAITLFLMITGGDVQTSFFGILLFIPIFFTLRKPVPFPHTLSRAFVPYAVSLLLACGLAAVQIFPAAEMTRESSRSRFAEKTPAAREETMSVYQFSVPPWRAAEFLLPGIGGREFPVNTRWFSSLPNDRQLWTPSLYMGLYPFLAAVSAFILFSRKEKKSEQDRIRVFLSWLTLLTFIAAWGGYGPGWFWRVMNGGNPVFQESDPAGGLYWLMTRVIPGWSAFRYPAKMITFTSFGIALLAGFGWDRFKKGSNRSESRYFRFGLLFLSALSIAGFLFIRLGDPARLWFILTDSEFFGTRTIYGPCLPHLAKSSAAAALLQPGILAFLLFILTTFLTKRFCRFFSGILLILLCADLSLAQKWMVTSVPESVYTVKSPLTAELRSFRSNEILPPRLYRDPFLYPADFLNTVSPNRLAERVRWDRATLFQKNASEMGVANADVRGTFVPAGYYPISQYLRSSLNRWKESGIREPGFDRLLAALGIDAYLVSLPGNGEERGISFKRAVNGGKRARIIHNADRFTDWKDLVRYDLDAGTVPGETALITGWQPNRIDLDLQLRTSGSLILSEQFAPGWQGILFDKRNGAPGKPVSICRFASALRRVDLPAGEWRIVMEYRPFSFRLGLAVSGIAWGGLFFVLGARFFLKRRVATTNGSEKKSDGTSGSRGRESRERGRRKPSLWKSRNLTLRPFL